MWILLLNKTSTYESNARPQRRSLSSETSRNIGRRQRKILTQASSQRTMRERGVQHGGHCQAENDGPDVLKGTCFSPYQTMVYMENI